MMPNEIKYNTIAGNSEESNIQSSLLAMRRKYILPFLTAIILLILSEYFFLQEIFDRSNTAVLLLTGIGIIFSIAFIISIIRKYN
jgi:hypothetical protein